MNFYPSFKLLIRCVYLLFFSLIILYQFFFKFRAFLFYMSLFSILWIRQCCFQQLMERKKAWVCALPDCVHLPHMTLIDQLQSSLCASRLKCAIIKLLVKVHICGVVTSNFYLFRVKSNINNRFEIKIKQLDYSNFLKNSNYS